MIGPANMSNVKMRAIIQLLLILHKIRPRSIVNTVFNRIENIIIYVTPLLTHRLLQLPSVPGMIEDPVAAAAAITILQ